MKFVPKELHFRILLALFFGLLLLLIMMMYLWNRQLVRLNSLEGKLIKIENNQSAKARN